MPDLLLIYMMYTGEIEQSAKEFKRRSGTMLLGGSRKRVTRTQIGDRLTVPCPCFAIPESVRPCGPENHPAAILCGLLLSESVAYLIAFTIISPVRADRKAIGRMTCETVVMRFVCGVFPLEEDNRTTNAELMPLIILSFCTGS